MASAGSNLRRPMQSRSNDFLGVSDILLRRCWMWRRHLRPLALPRCLCTVAGLCAEPPADNWPQFRGPGGLGIGSDTISLPTAFGPAKALLWKTDLPLGHGSPCVWGDRIFITGFDSALKKLEVIAVNRSNGQIAWRQAIPATGL